MLTGFGLTKNEAKLYLALLRLGECKVSMLVKEARFRSGKIYEVLDSLAAKGLISYTVQNNVKHYFAHDPGRLQDYIGEKKRKLESEEALFRKNLHELRKIHSAKKDSCDVRVYDSVEGVRSALFMFMDKLQRNSTIRIYGANDDPKRDIVLLWRKYDDICKQKNVKTRVIMRDISKKGRAKRRSAKGLKSYRYQKGTDLSNFMVSQDTLLLFNFNRPDCIYINNHTHAEQFTDLFNFLWKNSEKL